MSICEINFKCISGPKLILLLSNNLFTKSRKSYLPNTRTQWGYDRQLLDFPEPCITS